jgi:hypothetical protein
MNSVLALGAKALSMAISLVCGVLTVRLVLGGAGVSYYALYSLLIALPSLFSYTDLGAGAAVVNAIAASDDPRHDPEVTARLMSVGRILLGFSAGVMTLNVVLLLTSGWSVLFGDAGGLPNTNLAAFLCLTVFSIGIPVGIWVRVQLGLRRNHVVILLQSLISPLTLLFVWLAMRMPQGQAWAFSAVGSYLASFVVSVLGLILTARATTPLVRSAVRVVLQPRRHPGVRVMGVGWPMLAQLVAGAIAMSSQRYVLAQSGTHADVAEFGVAAQVFLALLALVMAAGTALWPQYANKRHRGELTKGPFLLSALFAGGILVATTVIGLVNPWLFGLITDGKLQVSTATIVCFGLMVALWGAVYPLGMFIMDEPGIRFQVAPALLMAGSTLLLSIVLTPHLGAIGPLLGNSFAVLAFQVIPFIFYIRRHRERLYSPTPKEPAAVVVDPTTAG